MFKMYNTNGLIESFNLAFKILAYGVACAGITVIAYYLYSIGKECHEELRKDVWEKYHS